MKKILFTSLIITLLVTPRMAQTQDCDYQWVAEYEEKDLYGGNEVKVTFCVYAGQLFLCEGTDCTTKIGSTASWYINLFVVSFLHYRSAGLYNGVLFPLIGLGFGTYHGFIRIPGFYPELDIYIPYSSPIFFRRLTQ